MFKVGDTVEWVSTIGRHKTGVVTKILPYAMMVETDYLYHKDGKAILRPAHAPVLTKDCTKRKGE